MTNMLHVCTDLVRAACLENTLNERHIAITFYHAPMGDGRLAYARVGRHDRHAQAVFRVACNVAFNASLVFGEIAPHQRVVATVCGLVEELQSETGLRLRGLCHDEQTAGVFVYAVNESHLRVVRVIALQVSQMPRHSVDERAMKVACAGMNHQSCGFVHHHQLRIFIDHVEGNVFCLNLRLMTWAVEHQRHHIARAHLIVALHRLVVDVYESGIGSLLYAVTRRVLQLLTHELVHAHGLLTGVCLEAEMLV